MYTHFLSLSLIAFLLPFLAAKANSKSWTQPFEGNATLNESMFHSIGMGLLYNFSLLYITTPLLSLPLLCISSLLLLHFTASKEQQNQQQSCPWPASSLHFSPLPPPTSSTKSLHLILLHLLLHFQPQTPSSSTSFTKKHPRTHLLHQASPPSPPPPAPP